MIDLLKNHHETNADDVDVQLLMRVSAGTQARCQNLVLSLHLILKSIDVLNSEAGDAFLLQISLKNEVVFLDFLDNLIQLFSAHLRYKPHKLLPILPFIPINLSVVFLRTRKIKLRKQALDLQLRPFFL